MSDESKTAAPPDLPIPLFLTHPATRRSRAIPPFAVSAAMHVAVAAVFWAMHWLAPVRASPVPDAVRVRIGDRLYEVDRQRVLPIIMPAALLRRLAETPSERTQGRGISPLPAQPRMNVPVPQPLAAAKTKPLGPRIFQPSAPPDLSVPLQTVPPVAVWTPDGEMPKAPFKKFVAPGVRETAVAAAQLEAPPEFAVAQVATVTHPKIVRTFLPPPPASLGNRAKEGSTALPGDAVQVITDLARPEVAVDIATVPRVHRMPGLADGMGMPLAPPPPDRAAGVGAAAGNESRREGRPPGTGGGAVAGTLNPPGGEHPAAPLTLPSVPEVIRIENSANGKFDAVLVQSSVSDSIPGGRTLLRGRPIYTVYIAVGLSRDWLLHYSDPKTTPSAQSAAVVRLEPAAPITPPFPVLMFRPAAVVSPGDRYLVFAGVLNSAGTLQNVRTVVHGLRATEEVLLSSLSHWKFRPAMRDGVAVDVDFVLAVPTDREARPHD